MKSMSQLLLFTTTMMVMTGLLIFASQTIAQEAEIANVRTGPSKAALEASAKKGFRLSAKAVATIGVETKKFAGHGPLLIPQAALVYYGDSIGVYRHLDDWFKLVPVKIGKKLANQVLIKSDELGKDPEIAISGSALLRATEMDIFEGEE